ncbi:DEKNAAC100500 [Brettanomyces naardenensis]|uniref:ornithine carbamoyltransferase n=1 Tax=Brettanomyces naardenensis TaxID=13370 RepID=A0A448YGI3_BRENA|nr:DEKNAAC100500 [Brettanomyces naardenensis]
MTPSEPASSLRHLVSISHLSTPEFKSLVNRAEYHKKLIKSGEQITSQPLQGKTIALLFTKRSTRTRVSTEGAAVYFGAHPMFLGKDDIQLGVNESLHDTTKIISSMTSCIFARVNQHSDIQELCKYSSVPIVNALCDTYHPLQAICDLLTIKETFHDNLENLKLAWIGDANNVINDLSIAALRMGINVAIATPQGVEIADHIRAKAAEVSKETGAKIELTHDPKVAATGANILVTDTFVSMGEESQKAEKLAKFKGFQINSELGALAAPNWKFMHCLPRHKEEVSDDVFYGDHSIVFPEGENRLYAAIATVEAFVVNKGKFVI